MSASPSRPLARSFVTGANRGIGLALCQQLAATEVRVYAGCRDPSRADALAELQAQHPDRVHIVAVDVEQDDSVATALASIAEREPHLDLVINNAGLNPRDDLATFDAARTLQVMNVNTVGPMRVVTAALPLLERAPAGRVINMSSQLGSLTQQRPGWGSPTYNASKAALNMMTRHLAFDLADRGILVAAVHPGWVRTDMGGASAPLAAEDAARDILALAARLTSADSGAFLVHDGTRHPW